MSSNPVPVSGSAIPKVVSAESLKEPMVSMLFPGPAQVRLALNDGRILVFEPGVRQVPQSLVDHEWLRVHGVKLVPGATPVSEEMKPVPEETRKKKG